MRLKSIPLVLLLAFLSTILLVLPLTSKASEGNDDVDFEDDLFSEQDIDASSADDIKYEGVRPKRYFWFDTFQGDVDPFRTGAWQKSHSENYAAQSIQWTTLASTGHSPVVGIAGDKGLLLTKEAQRYGFGHPLSISIDGKKDSEELVVQYEVKFEKSLECGGAYIKLLRDNMEIGDIKDDSPYVIMFGPDRCGTTDKVHFILQHRNPKSGLWEEKHLKDAPRIKNDQFSHVYTLVIRKDNTYEILIDMETSRKGSLLEDFQPPINPPKEIDDPEDKKPEDWVDNEMIDDPEATKPEDWVNEKTMADPEAAKPEDWDDEEDGEWSAPQVPNPDYVGEWQRPKIRNPAYKGEWYPRTIPNPNYFEDNHPHKLPVITGIAVEVWTMQKNMFFDNFLITDDLEVAKEFADETWRVKFDLQKEQVPQPKQPTISEGFWELLEQLKIVAMEYPIISVGVIGSIVVTVPLTIVCIRMIFNSSSEDITVSPPVRHTRKDKESESERESPPSSEEEEGEKEREGDRKSVV